MPQITKISPQRKSGRFNLFLDGKFTSGIDTETVIKEKLHTGLNLESEKIDKIILKQQETKLLEKTLKFLGFRPRSEKEVTDYLCQKIAKGNSVKFKDAKESPIVARILLKLKRYGLVDDEEFTKWWVTARSKQKGKIIIRAELIKKGVNREIIDRSIARLKDEITLAKKVLGKKFKRWSKLNKFEFKKKAYPHLARRGFSADIINDTIAFFTKKE